MLEAENQMPGTSEGDLLAELQSLGVRLEEDANACAVRKGGAGPSDHLAVSVGKATVMVPVLSDGARSSPTRRKNQ